MFFFCMPVQRFSCCCFCYTLIFFPCKNCQCFFSRVFVDAKHSVTSENTGMNFRSTWPKHLGLQFLCIDTSFWFGIGAVILSCRYCSTVHWKTACVAGAQAKWTHPCHSCPQWCSRCSPALPSVILVLWDDKNVHVVSPLLVHRGCAFGARREGAHLRSGEVPLREPVYGNKRVAYWGRDPEPKLRSLV